MWQSLLRQTRCPASMAEGKLTLVAEFGSRDLVGFLGAFTRREVERRSRRSARRPWAYDPAHGVAASNAGCFKTSRLKHLIRCTERACNAFTEAGMRMMEVTTNDQVLLHKGSALSLGISRRGVTFSKDGRTPKTAEKRALASLIFQTLLGGSHRFYRLKDDFSAGLEAELPCLARLAVRARSIRQ